jgi:hypothetical protein
MTNESAPPQPVVPIAKKRLLARPLLRLFGWGCMACLALGAAVLVSETEAGAKRLRYAMSFGGEPAQAVATLPPASTISTNVESQRLMARLRDLTADRDRLSARVAMLEHNLEDMTGSIKKQSEQIAAARAAQLPAATAPAFTLAPPDAAPELPFFMSMRTPQAAEPPLPPVRLEDAAALPPIHVASRVEHESQQPSANGEFAVDLGGAASIEALRAHWSGLKANYGPLLAGLEPLVAQHAKQPSGVTYRLIAGPFATSEEAARLCSRFAALRAGCHPAKFAGARLPTH